MDIRKDIIELIGKDNLPSGTIKNKGLFKLLIKLGHIPKERSKAGGRYRVYLMRNLVKSILSSNNSKTTKSIESIRLSTKFYTSFAWRSLRYEMLTKYGRICMLCGDRPPYTILHVDHIKPRSLHPELELDPKNLQILCEACNRGKSNKDSTDFRPL